MTTQNNAAQAAEQDPINAAILILTEEADTLSDCHTRTIDDWAGEDEVKARYDHIRAVIAALSKLRAPVPDERAAVDPCGYVAVKVSAVDWLKDKFPALTIKAGLCERVGGRLYTITRLMRDHDAALASAPVAGEAMTDEMIQAGAKAAREYFERTGGNDPAVIYSAMRAAAPAAPQASAENDWKAAIRKFMDTAIPALAAIANVHTPDEIDAQEAMPREPVIDQVRRLSQACEELSRQVRPERPKADKDAARCTCPSGDGSMRHPCAEHPPAEACKKEM